MQVPADHMARVVREYVDQFDLSLVEAGYSSLGRYGYQPRDVLAVWLYAGTQGVHHATKLHSALCTDAAYRWLAGGHEFAESTLKRFRKRHGALFLQCLDKTIRIAVERGLIDPMDLSTDSVRVRAHASMGELRTLERSQKRVAELAGADTGAMSEAEREKHQQRLANHQHTVERCQAEGRTEVVRTNPLAARQKFPGGGVHLGHRVTVTAAGRSLRLVVGVLVDADQSDAGKLQPAVEQARAALLAAGVPPEAKMQVSADSGYTAERDLAFAAEARKDIDVLAPVDGIDRSKSTKRGLFGRDRFTILPDGTARCPADKPMRGPHKDGRRLRYEGNGCPSCPLRSQCTDGKKRVLNVLPHYDRLRDAMHDRMAQPDATARYHRRAVTIEPVFASVENEMNFRRCSSRFADTIVAEILLKLLAHNIRRLASARRSSCVLVWAAIEF